MSGETQGGSEQPESEAPIEPDADEQRLAPDKPEHDGNSKRLTLKYILAFIAAILLAIPASVVAFGVVCISTARGDINTGFSGDEKTATMVALLAFSIVVVFALILLLPRSD